MGREQEYRYRVVDVFTEGGRAISSSDRTAPETEVRVDFSGVRAG